MKRLCRELERHLESGAEHLPDALEAHRGECAKCQRAWRLHQAYQRALHTARGEPTPACELPWSRVQAQLAARAVSRRPFAWLRPALAWGIAVAVVLVVGAALLPWGSQPPSQGKTLAQAQRSEPRVPDTPPKADTTRDSAGAVRIEAQGVALALVDPRAPVPRIVAQATPRMGESARLQPPASEIPQTGAHAARLRDTETPARRPIDRTEEVMGAPAFGSASESPFIVASLPLTPFGVGDSATGVEYLPISYGSPSSYREGSSNEAIIGSF
jgi:hypothetical protein